MLVLLAFTVLVGFSALVGCVYCMRSCINAANEALSSAHRAEQTEVRLKVARGDVIALRAHVGALEAQLQRIVGRVYRTSARASKYEKQDGVLVRTSDDIAGALMEAGGEAAIVGAAHEAMGVGLAAPSIPKTCKCGYCDVCLNGPTAPVQAH